MTATERRCGVAIVGAGLAGLVAGDELAQRGADVQVLEASPAVGGRVFGETGGPDTGAEFVGAPHAQLRSLIARLGLTLRSAGIERAPTLWRLPGLRQVSRRPPGSCSDLRSFGSAWWQLRRQALTLDPVRPWDSAGIRDLDDVSLADWLAARGATDGALRLSDALVGGFATRPIAEVSAAQAAWWITASKGLLAALRSGQKYIVPGGAHQIPRLLAARLGNRVQLGDPVVAIRAHDNGVEVVTAQDIWIAHTVIVAVPLPALRRIVIEPSPASSFQSAVDQLSYGRAIKIAASPIESPPASHRSVVGAGPLAIAWRHDKMLAGIATAPASDDALVDDLATSFGLDGVQLRGITVTDWTNRPYIGGSYLVYRPGHITELAPWLHQHHHDLVLMAGADFSGWPNSMEGAVESGLAAAAVALRR
jgi:monoamine oxidase